MNTVKKGLEFEYHVQKTLQRYTFTLRQVGGRSDGGIDLKGSIQLNQQWNVIVQCKCEDRKPGPKYIREFQGVLSLQENTIGIFASSSNWTRETLNCFLFSEYAMMGLVLENDLKWFLNYKLQRDVPGLITSSNQLFYLQRPLGGSACQ
jgi:hypothetical protein